VVHFGFSVTGESKGVNLKLSPTAIQAADPPPKKYLGDLKRHTRACHERASSFGCLQFSTTPREVVRCVFCVGEIDRRTEIVAAEVVNTTAG
jgi:hypothetical protein